MTITILSVRERDGQIVARARAEADQAVIRLEVKFPLSNQRGNWERAYDEVLRYLDPA